MEKNLLRNEHSSSEPSGKSREVKSVHYRAATLWTVSQLSLQAALQVAENKKVKIKPRNIFQSPDDNSEVKKLLSSRPRHYSSQDCLENIRRDSFTFDNIQRKSTKKKHLFRTNTMDEI